MALRREDLTPEQAERQAALDRSWEGAQKALADPDYRAFLEERIRQINDAPPRPTLTREEFLALTELPPA